MKNRNLAQDYVIRAKNRFAAVELLYKKKSWADVVRESQEIVELLLKAVLRISNIEVPRIHDVSPLLLEHRDKLPKALHKQIDEFAEISRELRRDRELAFYGSEDLTPSEFYTEQDADSAKNQAKKILSAILKVIKL